MNKEIKDKWVEALKSDTYQQGKGTLQTNDNKFCCLGVLCDIYQKETGLGEWIHNDSNYMILGETGVLPISVMKWGDLDASNPFVLDNYLSKWNDNGASFEKIANLIENHL